MVAYVFDDFTQADKFSTWIETHGGLVPTFESNAIMQLFRALVALALVRQNKKIRRNLRVARKALRQFSTVFSLKCPENCRDKQHLLEAELASVSGQNDLAYAHYTSSIALAEKSDFLFQQALTHERLGFHLHRVGEPEKARRHLDKAVNMYSHWGARGKARYLMDVISNTLS